MKARECFLIKVYPMLIFLRNATALASEEFAAKWLSVLLSLPNGYQYFFRCRMATNIFAARRLPALSLPNGVRVFPLARCIHFPVGYCPSAIDEAEKKIPLLVPLLAF